MSNRHEIAPLLVTPRPYVDESQIGFLQRVADMNGYSSTSFLFNYYLYPFRGLLHPEDISTLAKMLNCSVSDLDSISLFTKNKRRNIRVMGHQLSFANTVFKSVKICPLCIQETGYIHTFGHLVWATICPIHNVKLISHCPECNKLINARSNSALKCTCGYKFNETELTSVDDIHLNTMMKIIFFKLNNKDIFKIDNRKSNFPIEIFSEISLRTLLGILQRLENKFTYQYRCSQRLDMERIKIRSTISQSFTNWPSNFPELIAELSVKKKSGDLTDLKRFQDALLKSTLPWDETRFLRKPINDAYPIAVKTMHYSSTKESNLSGENDLVFRRINDIAKHVGVTNSTIYTMIKRGLILEKRIKTSSDRALTFFIFYTHTPRKIKGRSCSEREVAKEIHLPVSILNILRKKRVYPRKYIGEKVDSYHEKDLIDFKYKLEQLCKFLMMKYKHKKFEFGEFRLQDLINMKSLTTEQKAQFIEDIFNSKIQFVNPKGHCLTNFRLNEKEVLNWISKLE